MKIILNPKYERLRDYLTHIDFHFEQEGKEIFTTATCCERYALTD